MCMWLISMENLTPLFLRGLIVEDNGAWSEDSWYLGGLSVSYPKFHMQKCNLDMKYQEFLCSFVEC